MQRRHPAAAESRDGAASNQESADQKFKFERVLSSSEPAFPVLARIWTETHPASELKSLAWLRRMLEDPRYIFLTASRAGSLGEPVLGFTISACFDGSDAALLEYMAIAGAHRNQGIGSLLFSETVNFGPLSERYVLIEVDSDKDLAGAAVEEEIVRRKAFYRNLGCREVEGLRYRMPRVSTAMPPAMDLLVYKQHLPRFIGKPRLRNWLEACFAQVYELRSDGRVDSMLEDLPETLRLI